MTPNEIINEKIGAWLLGKGKTREQFADEIGITRTTLRNRLSGKSRWRFDEVVEVARVCNCTIDELAG